MNKKLLTVVLFLGLSSGAFSQAVKQTIDKAAKNPATKENAAKADVRLIKKKAIKDSADQRNTQPTCPSRKKKKNASRSTQ